MPRKSPGIAHIEEDKVRHIKARIWAGETCAAIALDHDVTERAISHIRTGYSYAAIPWPNGAKGRIPLERQREILHSRKVASQDLKNSIRSQTNERLSELLDHNNPNKEPA